MYPVGFTDCIFILQKGYVLILSSSQHKKMAAKQYILKINSL